MTRAWEDPVQANACAKVCACAMVVVVIYFFFRVLVRNSEL